MLKQYKNGWSKCSSWMLHFKHKHTMKCTKNVYNFKDGMIQTVPMHSLFLFLTNQRKKKSIAISFFFFFSFKKGRKMGFGKKLSPLATKSFVAQRLRMESVIAFVDRYACALYANGLVGSQHCSMRYSNNNDR